MHNSRWSHEKALGDVAKVQVNINGKQDSLAVVKADGTFPCYLGSKLTSMNDKVEAVGLSNNGQELGRAAVTLN
ncbi:immunoglobulin-like domain-containing protein [Listeria fleischmannii]|uniref:immunoglobulin-like domain-containing protein n=1 Tax=Listeria fleischmannii TaxID=1069827 RepID=UPI0028936B7E|nr:immunoglobulin-like domain-containing protein [Listeria fleischmannii]